AVERAAPVFESRREHAKRRQAVIAANGALQERELIKLASLSAGIAEALRARGVNEPAASLTAETGVAVFKIAFERWINESNDRDLTHLMRESFDELKTVTVGSSSARRQ